MSCPVHFEGDPRLAWAFWHFRHQAYTKGIPHEGYRLLAKWGTGKPFGLFSVTSNIDGHWGRTEGVGPERVLEVHGAVTHMQCVEDDGRIWATDDAQIEGLDVPAWDLTPGEAVEVVLGSVLEEGPPGEQDPWTLATVGDDGASILSASGEPVAARAVRRPAGRDLTRVAAGGALPRCGATGAAARPNVLMFGDGGVNCGRIEAQQARFRAWADRLPRDARVAVVEVGAGTAIPTIRRVGEREAAARARAALVRINVDESGCPPALRGRCVGVGGVGALAALEAMEAEMERMRAAP
jgi:NAD-dependent SIR2 family protein deacetylase